jgi:biopolymer transport protein ExbD
MLKRSSFLTDESDGAPLIPRGSLEHHSEFDITAMIDLVFMMNIYFLVTTITAALADINLPSAQHCMPADREASVVVTILAATDRPVGGIYIGDDTDGEPFTDPDVQQREVLRAVEEGVRSQINSVIIRAEKDVPLRDVMRVARVVSAIEGVQLKVSVMEKE